jgi:epoxyqueuosine reductase
MLQRPSLPVLGHAAHPQSDKRCQLTARLKERARSLGFDVVGIAAAAPFAEARAALLERIGSGYLSGLKWFTAERAEFSSDPANLLPGVRSIISVAMSYAAEVAAPNADLGHPRGRVARYAWGRDYHEVLKERMNALVHAIEEEYSVPEGDQMGGEPGEYRALVDTARIIDRAVAARAGVGWYGKSTNIITTSPAGSWIFLGEVLTVLDLQPDVPLRKNCGSCDLCLRACPTGAIVRPYVLDSNRCISYLTIEHRGAIPRDLRPLIGDWVFGCDICQEVCPPNARPIAAPTEHADFQLTDPSLAYPDLVELLQITPEEFSMRFRHSPIKRAKHDGLRRNAAVAIGNSGDQAAVPALARALNDDSALVRTHVAWALGRLGGVEAEHALIERLECEQDDEVREEIALALQDIKDS